MSYDIPPPLQHKEKIAFGLTFSQLAIATPAFLVIFILVFKTKLQLEISGSIALFVVAVSSFLMFFDGINKIKHIITYIKNREVKVHSDKLKKIVDIQKITVDTIHTSKTKLAILEVIPLNFMIKTKEEQESIITGFQKFLNSLDFPIQIHISSNLISLEDHLNHIKGHTDEEFFISYQKFIQDSVKNNKNRRFYIIIQERDNLEMQINVCRDKLEGVGVKVRRLHTNELLNLFHEYTAHKKQKKVAENQVVENYTHFLLSPEKITFYHDFFEFEDTFCTVLSVRGYPHSVEMGFLDKIISSSDNYDISLHIEPFPIEITMIELNKELQKQQSDLYAESKRGVLNPSLDIKFKSTRHVLEELQKGKQKLFNVSLYIMCKGKTKEESTLLAKKVKADLDGLMIQSTIPTFQMMECYESMLPLARDTVRMKRNIHTQGLSAFFPFSSPFLDVEDDGILLGLNKNGIPYIKNIFNLTNANGLILATSGAGKSYFSKLLISRQFMNDTDILIIDPQGEYSGITQQYKGEVITISKNSKTIINPLDLMGHEYLQKRLALMDVFQIMFGDLTEPQKAILDVAIEKTYAKKGITRDGWKNRKPPKMSDLYQTMKQSEKKCARLEKVTYRALMNRLRMYTKDGVFLFLDRDTNINFRSNFVCFNIGEMPKQVKPLVMYLVLDYVYMRMKKSLRKKILVIDEAWSLLQTAEESSYIFEIVKTCRKFNLGLLMITQDVADLVSSNAGSAVLANSAYTFLLRQKPAVISNVKRTFNLSDHERDYLVTAEKGQGILILENEHQELNVIASDKEHDLITTDPNEVVVEEAIEEEEERQLDLERDVYPAKNLSLEEKNILSANDYTVGCFHNLTKGRQKEYFVKRKRPEGAKHTFYVDLIYKEIRKHTKEVKKYQTEKPDLVFVNKKGKEVAIEVETGDRVKFLSEKTYHNKKFAKVREEYGKRCYIFLPKARLENSYKRHGLPILFRLDVKKFVMSMFK